MTRTGSFRPLVMIPDWHSPQLQEREWQGIHTLLLRLRAPDVGDTVSLRLILTYLLTLPDTLFRLQRLLRRYDVRVVNAHYPSLVMVNFALLRLLGLYRGKLLLSFHGLDVSAILAAQSLDRTLWHWLFRHVDANICCSDGLAGRLHKFSSKIDLITVHNGISPQRLNAEKELVSHICPLDRRPFILNVGTFEYKKGQDVLVRAFSRIALDFAELDLIILGRDGPTRAEIQSLVIALELQERVHFGIDVPHAEVLAFFEKATIFAFPSRSEPLGIAALEAGFFGISSGRLTS